MNLGKQIAQGNTAKIYLHKNQIIKVFHDYFPREEAIKEAAKQEAVRACGLPVPRVFNVTKIDSNPAIIMEFIKGKTLGDLLIEGMEKADFLMACSVDIQLKIHKVNLNSIEPMALKLKRQINAAHKLNDIQKTRLIEKLDKMEVNVRLCHGDFHLFNIIRSDHKDFIIDWVDASVGDARADVYRTYLLYTQQHQDLADLYLKTYCNKSGISKDKIMEWAPIIAGARLSEMVPSEDSKRLLCIVNNYEY